MGTLGKSIVVVEDERVVARDLERRLEALGYRVSSTVATADDAVAETRRCRPDLVLMDIHLKGTPDGIDAARRIAREQDVPVVYLTAYADHDTLERAKQSSPYGYLVKPVETDSLSSAVEIALQKHASELGSRRQARWFAAVLDAIDEAIVWVGADGRVEIMNAAAERLTGWRATEAMGHPAAEVVQLVEADGLPVLPFERALRDQRSLLATAILVRRTGDEASVRLRASPFLDEVGGLHGALLILCDATR